MSDKDFAEALVDAFERSVALWHCRDDIDSPEALRTMKQAKADLLQALRVPAPEHQEDFPSVRDQFAMAALPAVRIAYAEVHGIFLDADAAAKYAKADADAMMEARKGGA
jgi:hypothetical protein